MNTATRASRWIVVLLGAALGWIALAHAQERPHTQQVPAGVRALRDLEYARVDGKPLLLDLYLPEKVDGPLPVIVWIHGGGWVGGSKSGGPALRMAPRGYAVASVEYRFSQVATFPAQIYDCKAAIRWLRAHAAEYRLDPDHFGAWGASAGGHLVALLGTSGGVKEMEGDEGNAQYSSRVQAVCDWFGPTDFRQIPTPRPANANGAEGLVTQLLGGPIEEHREKAAQASPAAFITKEAPPFLIMHGSQDPLVPVSQSELFYQALKKAGVEAEAILIVGAGHGGPEFSTPEAAAMIDTFFDRHLKQHK